jgi:pimeloyl-ACP methyl ester carboxylesterase
MNGWRTSTMPSNDGTRIAVHSAGSGAGLIVVGGALRAAIDYFALADCLAQRFEVHVLDRRGRGASGPQGPTYSLQQEIDDLIAVRDRTNAALVFGHSYGGLIALRTAALTNKLDRVAVYEPGISINGSIPTSWTARYRDLLQADDRRGAFAHFVQHSSQAPTFVQHLPQWYLKTILRVVLKGEKWKRMDQLQEASAAEHDEVGRAKNDAAVYRQIRSRVLLLGGQRSPANMTSIPFAMLHKAIADSEIDILPDLDHLAPDDKDPLAVAQRLQRFFS